MYKKRRYYQHTKTRRGEENSDHNRYIVSKPILIIVTLLIIGIGCYFYWQSVYAPRGAFESSAAKNNQQGPLIGQTTKQVDCDYFINNATIVDGSGAPPYKSNIAIKGQEIVAIGSCVPSEKARVIDASGMIVCPGFIDLHTHTDDYWEVSPDGAPALMQGVTTHIVGNCGDSPQNIAAYLQKVDHNAINVGVFVGYKVLREAFVRPGHTVTFENITAMQKRLASGIKNGAFGLSLGLSYYPQNQITYQELLALAQTTKEDNAVMAIHIRSEGDNLISSLREALKIAEDTGVSLQYNHIKASGKANWYKQEQALELFNQAIEQGLDVSGDAYIYTYSSHDLANDYHSISADNIIKVIKNEHVMIASDAGLSALGKAIHPRAYANHTAFICRYVRDKHILDIQEAIKKMTSMPAQKLGLTDRGLLAVGKKSDIVVFRLADLKENATRKNPSQLSYGMSYVFVNGALAVDKGKITGIKAGNALRR
ncbi:MAG: N-acyl-D-amino-acid deacylase family protein [Bacillota bacterium]